MIEKHLSSETYNARVQKELRTDVGAPYVESAWEGLDLKYDFSSG